MDRLDYLRGEIEAERISTNEIMELTGLAEDGLIPDHDVVLLQWAGVPEFGKGRVRASRNVTRLDATDEAARRKAKHAAQDALEVLLSFIEAEADQRLILDAIGLVNNYLPPSLEGLKP